MVIIIFLITANLLYNYENTKQKKFQTQKTHAKILSKKNPKPKTHTNTKHQTKKPQNPHKY